MSSAAVATTPTAPTVNPAEAARERAVTEYKRKLTEHRDVDTRLKESKDA